MTVRPLSTDADDAAASQGSPRFVALRVDYLDRIEHADLNLDAWAVIGYLILKAKTSGDTGVVWTCSTAVSRTLRNLTHDRAKRALEHLEKTGFIRRFRQRGSRCLYPLVIDGYVVFTSARQALVVDARETADWRKPALRPARQATRQATPRLTHRHAPQATPPLLEPRTENLNLKNLPAPEGAELVSIPLEDREGGPAPTGAAIERWNDRRARDGLGPMSTRQTKHLCRVVADVWPAAKHRVEVLLAAIDSYFDDRGAFTCEQGHSVGEFQRRSDHWLRKALGTAALPTPRGPLSQADAALAAVLAKPNGHAQLEAREGVPW